MTELIKCLAPEGYGVAWLSRSLGEAEIGAGQPLVVAPKLLTEIWLYRNGPRARSIVERVWQCTVSGRGWQRDCCRICYAPTPRPRANTAGR